MCSGTDFCVIVVDLFSLHTCAHGAMSDDCCFSQPSRLKTIYIVKDLHKIEKSEGMRSEATLFFQFTTYHV